MCVCVFLLYSVQLGLECTWRVVDEASVNWAGGNQGSREHVRYLLEVSNSVSARTRNFANNIGKRTVAGDR